MKGMQKVSRGKGFAGVLKYAAQGDEKVIGHGRLIGGNMAGKDEKSLALEFKMVASQRHDIEKPVWHNALRMPKNEDVSDEKWRLIADDYMQEMGFDPDNYQYCVWKHDDDEHIHIIANRVGLNKKIYLGQNENLVSTRIIQGLEKRHGLTITKGPDRDADGNIVMPEVSTPKKTELEKALRTGEKPPRMVLQELVAEAWKGRPSTGEFMERLEAAGVDVLPNLASTGRMNGFSFRYDGLKFSGSELGQKYKWAAIQKEIDYVEARDREALARRRDAHRGTAENDATTAAVTPSDPGTAPVAGEGIGVGISDRTDSPSPARNPGAATVDGPTIEEHRGRTTEERQGPDSHTSGASIGESDPKGFDLGEGVRIVVEAARPAERKDLTAKVAAWRKQHAALDAPNYRITLKDRVQRDGKDRSHSVGKSKVPGVTETVYNAKQVEAMIPQLRAKNTEGFDVYLTPLDPTYHHIVVDDLTPAKLKDLKADGYQPALVQSSSADNLQAVIRVRREGRADEQTLANKLVSHLNKQFGDPKFSGVIHPFRMAGFSNKKPGKRNAFTRVLEAAGVVCSKAMQYMASLRNKVDSEAAKKAADEAKAERITRIQYPEKHTIAGPGRAYQQQAHWLVKGKTNPDWSAVDYGVACELFKKGWDADDVAKAIREGSPQLAERHTNTEGYLRRTIDAATRSVGVRSTPANGNGLDSFKPD